MIMPSESLCLNPANVTLNNGYYNASIAVNCSRAITLQKFLVYSETNSSVGADSSNGAATDFTVYLNRTAENPNQLDFKLKTGESLQVNLIILRADYLPGANMGFTVTSP